jgi:hypothetical protein
LAGIAEANSRNATGDPLIEAFLPALLQAHIFVAGLQKVV